MMGPCTYIMFSICIRSARFFHFCVGKSIFEHTLEWTKIYWGWLSGSVFKVKVRVKFKLVLVRVRLMANLKETNVSLCYIPKSSGNSWELGWLSMYINLYVFSLPSRENTTVCRFRCVQVNCVWKPEIWHLGAGRACENVFPLRRHLLLFLRCLLLKSLSYICNRITIYFPLCELGSSRFDNQQKSD